MSMELRGTTICAVRKNGHTSIAGDGQVTMGQSVIFKSHAHKVRRLYGGQVVIGFAGAVADAFTLCDKFEEKLTQCGGNLERAAVALARGILAGDKEKLANYRRFLTLGGSMAPIEELKVAGVDMSTPQPVCDALDYFAELVMEYKTLLDKEA